MLVVLHAEFITRLKGAKEKHQPLAEDEPALAWVCFRMDMHDILRDLVVKGQMQGTDRLRVVRCLWPLVLAQKPPLRAAPPKQSLHTIHKTGLHL